MKKLLSLLLTLLMVLTLVACNSKKEEPTPTVDEPVVVEKQEEEVKQEEPVIVQEETKEEKEETTTKGEETKTLDVVDPSIYDYWVVVYDQYGNELSRTTAHYGTIVKDPNGKDVKVLTNTYFHTTIDYPSSKKDGGSSGPTLKLPSKGDLIILNGDSTKVYRVLKMNGTQAKLLAMFDAAKKQFNTDKTNTVYEGSILDNYLVNTFYPSLPSVIQEAIVPQNIIQKFYKSLFPAPEIIEDVHVVSEKATGGYFYFYYDLSQNVTVGERKVFTLGVEDIIEYFDGNHVIYCDPLIQMFYNKCQSELTPDGNGYYKEGNIWLSSNSGAPEWLEYGVNAINLIEVACTVDYLSTDAECNVRPAFVIDLAAENVEWNIGCLVNDDDISIVAGKGDDGFIIMECDKRNGIYVPSDYEFYDSDTLQSKGVEDANLGDILHIDSVTGNYYKCASNNHGVQLVKLTLSINDDRCSCINDVSTIMIPKGSKVYGFGSGQFIIKYNDQDLNLQNEFGLDFEQSQFDFDYSVIPGLNNGIILDDDLTINVELLSRQS